MRGPVDFVVVGFAGLNFDGSVLSALSEAIDSGAIALIDLAFVAKDEDGVVTKLNIAEVGDEYVLDFVHKYEPGDQDLSAEDYDEVSDLLENNTAAGILIVEHLWAKPLKKALINANGILLAEGRIHPDAAAELNDSEEE